MRRRHLLSVAALAGLAAACGPARTPARSATPTPTPGPTPSTGPTPVSPGPTPTTTGSGLDLRALRGRLTGSLLLPGDGGYPEAARPYNAALAPRRPLAIVRAANADDVATCVRLAGGRGVPLAARSGGHSYEGWSTPDGGVVLDVSGLRGVRVRSDGTAVVGSGARLTDVYTALAASGRALPGGSCPSVGIAGLTLGGGIGVLCRAYGLTCDRLDAADVVTADGELRRVDANRDAELFWALRGGGGGNAGVVTAFTFTTVPAPDVSVFSLSFPAARTAEVLLAWQAWMAAAPKTLWSLCGLTGGATPANRISGTWIGRADQVGGHLAELIAAVGTDPVRRYTERLGYLDAMRYYASGSSGRVAFRAASRMLERRLDADGADAVVGLLRGGSPIVLLFDALGGTVGAVGAAETAFPHRRASASVQIYSGAADATAAVARVDQGLAGLAGHGAYVNYLASAQRDWSAAYYGANLPRLVEVVRRYDPSGVFDFPQSIRRAVV
jgi:FAD/FMN-containing dehydrogenase